MKEQGTKPLSRKRPTSILMIMLYVVWGFTFFFLGVYVFFPKDQIRSRLEQELSARMYSSSWGNIRIQDLDVYFFHPGIHLGKVTLTHRSSEGEETSSKRTPPRIITIDSIDVYVSWWDLLLGKMPPSTIQAEIKALGGQISLQLERTETEPPKNPRTQDEGVNYRIHFQGKQLQFAEISKAISPIPFSGTFEFSSELTLPMDRKLNQPKIRSLQGTTQVSIQGLTLGDGKTKFSLDSLPSTAQLLIKPLLQKYTPSGIPIPKLQFGTMSGRVLIKNERASLEGWQFKNPVLLTANTPATGIPMTLLVDGFISLGESSESSSYHLYLKISPWRKILEGVVSEIKTGLDPKKDEELIKSLEEQSRPLLDLVQMQERTDGFLGFAITGSLTNPVLSPQQNNPVEQSLLPSMVRQ